jgi:uncharacterized membrane protein (UPF0182 family)
MRVPTAEGRQRRPLGLRIWLIVGVVLLIILLLSLRGLARFYTDYLWFKDVGFQHTWSGLLSAKIFPPLIFATIFFVAMLINLTVADRVAPRYRSGGPEDEIIERYRGYVAPYAGRIRVLVSLFFALVMGSGVSSQWQNWILFSHATSFGVKDPQFHKDVGFYVFRLPFEQFAAGWTFAALLVILIVSAVFHYLNGGIRLQSPFQRVTPQVKVHLSVLLALMSLTKTVQYYLAQFSLTLSHRGTVDGATYTDVHAQLPALRLLMLISIAAAALFIVNIWRRGWVFPIIAVGLWGFISIVVGTIYPAVIQQFTVKPNELTRETPYIQRNIAATQAAFNLSTCPGPATPASSSGPAASDSTSTTTTTTLPPPAANTPQSTGTCTITQQPFTYSANVEAADATTSRPSLDNVRLYDPPQAQEAFQTVQRLYPFYGFNDVDVDRYPIGNEPNKPTLAAVRELDLSHLPNNSWTSQHLVYTHGYGVVAAAADQVNGDQPSYLMSGIPPTGELSSQLQQQYTGVYFGENLGGYAVVDTKVPEQEAAGGGATKSTSYQGNAGVKVSSFVRKMALAARFGDWTFLWSSQVTSNSRVIYIRDVQDRVKTLAPFLHFDADPYPVVLNGHILWVLDAYTITNSYPYSQSIHPDVPNGSGLDTNFNYVRNSVKATVDAYTGQVNFYVVDPSDPIIRTYQKAFPKMFKSVDKMPEGLRAHWRYPEDIFRAQTEQYSIYHITDPVQFYNKQNIWEVAPNPESGDNTSVTTAPAVSGNNGGRNNTLATSGPAIDPLYMTLQLPGEKDPEFVLEREFVPRNAANLTSFVFARTDGANYGKLSVYNVSDSTVPSPAQAATLIASDPTISKEITLLGTGGSQVQLGQVQMIPVGGAIVYVRPMWVVGIGSQTFPRYQFVTVASGNNAVLGTNMNDAITGLITGNLTEGAIRAQTGQTGPGTAPNNSTTTTTVPGGPAPPPTGNQSAQQLFAAANQQFAQAQVSLAKGDLGGYQSHNAAGYRLNTEGYAKLTGGATTTTTAPKH